MRYSFWGAKWRVWSLLFMGTLFFQCPGSDDPHLWGGWDDPPNKQNVDEHRTWEDQLKLLFILGCHGKRTSWPVEVQEFTDLQDWDDLNEAFFLGHLRGPGVWDPYSKISKTELLFRVKHILTLTFLISLRNLTLPGGISETSGFTLGYPVIPGTSLRKPPGHHGFNLKISLQSTEISKGIGMRSTGQHAWSRRARGGEGATSWKHLHIRSVVYEMAWVCGKASHFPWFSSRGRLGSQLYLEINGSVSLGLAHYYDHSLVFQLIRPWKKSPNFPGSNDWPKSIVIHLGYSKIMPRPTKSRTIMIWF